jgi:hypothetical protein
MCVDVVRDGENGILLTRDAKQNAARISALLDQDGLELHRLQEGAYRSAAETPDWAAIFSRHFEIYSRIAGA